MREIYPYTNDELNKQLVELAKFDYVGLAIMLSIVQKVYITEKDAANNDIFRNERVDSQFNTSGPLTL